MLDDLHWADAETLAMLMGLVDMPLGTPVLVVAAYRPDEIEGGSPMGSPYWPGGRRCGCPCKGSPSLPSRRWSMRCACRRWMRRR